MKEEEKKWRTEERRSVYIGLVALTELPESKIARRCCVTAATTKTKVRER